MASSLPVGRGYLQLGAGASQRAGWWVRGEGAHRLAPAWSLYGYGQTTQHEGWSAGAGARWSW